MLILIFSLAYVVIGIIGLDMAGHVGARNIAEIRAKRAILKGEAETVAVKEVSKEILREAPPLRTVCGSKAVAICQVIFAVLIWPVYVPVSLYNWNHYPEDVARFMGIDV